MDKEDAVPKPWSSFTERRKQVIRLHKRGIKDPWNWCRCRLSYPAVRKVLDLFEQGGWQASNQPVVVAQRRCPIAHARARSPHPKDHLRNVPAIEDGLLPVGVAPP